jgi:ABC-type bacteriocin/lantibiotic exporter with double-glycine peptidase domain
MQGSDLLLITLPIILVVVLFTIFYLNPIHKKNTEQLPQNKPIDRQKITSIEVTGNVESIHRWYNSLSRKLCFIELFKLLFVTHKIF